MSKGSTPRPFSVSQAEYESRWDAIFQRDLPVVKESLTVQIGDTTPEMMREWTPEEKEKLVEAMEGILQKSNSVELHQIKAGEPSRSLIEGIMSTETCGHPFCQCVDVCKEAK